VSAKIIVSYDGTANEEDAIALGRIFAAAGADIALAYVRHAPEGDSAAEQRAQSEAQDVLSRGIEILGTPDAERHVVIDPSTPHGLARLAAEQHADVVVFCSDSHTAQGHVSVGNSAGQLLEGGTSAVAIAPVGLAERGEDTIHGVVAVGDGDGGAVATADSLAAALGATVEPVIDEQTGLLVIDSRTDAPQGSVLLSSSAAHLIEIATCAVLVLSRGNALRFSAATSAQHA